MANATESSVSTRYQLTYTGRFEELLPLYLGAGIDGNLDDPKPVGFVTSIEAIDTATGETVGAASISYHDDVHHLNDLAVLESYRGQDIGTILVHECISDIKKRGGHSMWLTGRAPEFYKKLGFAEVPLEDSLLEFVCPGCSQYQQNCFPAIMKIDF